MGHAGEPIGYRTCTYNEEDDGGDGKDNRITTTTTTDGGSEEKNEEQKVLESQKSLWRTSIMKPSIIAQGSNEAKATTDLITVGENYSRITGVSRLLSKDLDCKNLSNHLVMNTSNVRQLSAPDLATGKSQTKFLSFASRMFFKKNPSTDGKELQVISLMSNESEKEIAPRESFKQIIVEIHSKKGIQGQDHLSVAGTIAGIKKAYTFGHRDFGMSAALVSKVIAECPAPGCLAHASHGKAFGPSDPAERRTCNPSTTAPIPLIVDQFYQDVACIIVEDELQLFCPKAIGKEKEIRDKIVNIKKAGGFPNARASKRKIEDKETQGGKVKTTPTAESMIEGMSMEESYDCLVQLACQMRRELLVAYAGERRHYERLNKSVMAALALVRKCQSVNNSANN